MKVNGRMTVKMGMVKKPIFQENYLKDTLLKGKRMVRVSICGLMGLSMKVCSKIILWMDMESIHGLMGKFTKVIVSYWRGRELGG